MKKVLVERKVNVAQNLLQEALAPRRRAKPGELVHYHTYSGEGSDATHDIGHDVVELTRTREPSIFLKRLKRWLFSAEVMLLPRDTRYSARVERFLAGE